MSEIVNKRSRPRLNVVGAGKLGSAIAMALVQAQRVTIGQVCNQHLLSAEQVINNIGEGVAVDGLSDLVSADAWLITVPDDQIQSICDDLSGQGVFGSGVTVIHCSGALTSDALSSARSKGCAVGSWHPIHSFANLNDNNIDWQDLYFSFEGDGNAKQLCALWTQSIGAQLFLLSKDQKTLYHGSLVIAANGGVALADSAIQLMHLVGVNKAIAYDSVLSVMESALKAMRTSLSTQSALTGPVQRRDVVTVSEHMAVLNKQTASEHYDLYCLLSNYLGALCRREEPDG